MNNHAHTRQTPNLRRTLGNQSTLLRALIALSLLLVGDSQAQLPEDQGPVPVGIRSVSFSHPLSANSTVTADVFYPALSAGQNTAPDLANGPYPLVAFLHGYFAPPSFYSDLTAHIASYGFVVAAVGTESGFFQNIQNEAHDAHAMLHWVDEQGANPASFLYGMSADGPWSAVGHSNGAAAIFYALAWESRIEYVVSTEGNWFQIPTVSQFEGSFLSIGSSEDLLAPPSVNARRYYNEASATRRRVYAQIQGGGHNGSLDFPSSIHSLSHNEQNRLHRRLITGFLRAEVLREQDLYYHLIGGGLAGEPIIREALCPAPLLWTAHDGGQPGTLTAGVASMPSEDLSLAWSRAPSVQAIGRNVPGLSGVEFHATTVGSDGIEEVSSQLPTSASGSTLNLRGISEAVSSWSYTRKATVQIP